MKNIPGTCRIKYADAIECVEFLADCNIDFDNLPQEYSDADKLQVKMWIASIINVAIEFGRKRQQLIEKYGKRNEAGELIFEMTDTVWMTAILPSEYFVVLKELNEEYSETDIQYPPYLLTGIVDISKYVKNLLPF